MGRSKGQVWGRGSFWATHSQSFVGISGNVNEGVDKASSEENPRSGALLPILSRSSVSLPFLGHLLASIFFLSESFFGVPKV